MCDLETELAANELSARGPEWSGKAGFKQAFNRWAVAGLWAGLLAWTWIELRWMGLVGWWRQGSGKAADLGPAATLLSRQTGWRGWLRRNRKPWTATTCGRPLSDGHPAAAIGGREGQ